MIVDKVMASFEPEYVSIATATISCAVKRLQTVESAFRGLKKTPLLSVFFNLLAAREMQPGLYPLS